MTKYRFYVGTSKKIFYILTINDDEKMVLTFHGIDRTIEKEAELAPNAWIVCDGLMLPPLETSKWVKIEE